MVPGYCFAVPMKAIHWAGDSSTGEGITDLTVCAGVTCGEARWV